MRLCGPAHTKAEQTRALWRAYLRNQESLNLGAAWPDDAASVGRMVGLLREQRRILGELLGCEQRESNEDAIK